MAGNREELLRRNPVASSRQEPAVGVLLLLGQGWLCEVQELKTYILLLA